MTTDPYYHGEEDPQATHSELLNKTEQLLSSQAINARQLTASTHRPSAPSHHEPGHPRIIVYHQTHEHQGEPISILPLIHEKTGVTHVIVAAIHLNAIPGDITINDDAWDSDAHATLRAEIKALQAHGVKVLGMLGGAAKGTFLRLDTPLLVAFHAYYGPLRNAVQELGLDGLDLDVEEPMSLSGAVKLVRQLRQDFGQGFLITMAPVATALMGGGRKHLSGFDYKELEAQVGREIAWYNTQFYNGCGWSESTTDYDTIIAAGWDPSRVVLGIPTNPDDCRGWVPDDIIRRTLATLMNRYPSFGGVMGWEYYRSITVAEPYGWPWCWAKLMTSILRPLDGDLAMGTVSLEDVMIEDNGALGVLPTSVADALRQRYPVGNDTNTLS